AWRQAIALRDVWDAPFRQLARYAMTTGQLDAAEEYAEAAYLRRPGHAENAIVIAQVRSAGIKPGDRETVAEVPRLLDEIDAATGGSTRTLLLRVNTLAQAGETAALHDLLRNVAEQRPQLPHEVISRLIDVAAEYELPVADELRSLSAASAETPPSALADAVRLIESHQIHPAIEPLA